MLSSSQQPFVKLRLAKDHMLQTPVARVQSHLPARKSTGCVQVLKQRMRQMTHQTLLRWPRLAGQHDALLARAAWRSMRRMRLQALPWAHPAPAHWELPATVTERRVEVGARTPLMPATRARRTGQRRRRVPAKRQPTGQAVSRCAGLPVSVPVRRQPRLVRQHLQPTMMISLRLTVRLLSRTSAGLVPLDRDTCTRGRDCCSVTHTAALCARCKSMPASKRFCKHMMPSHTLFSARRICDAGAQGPVCHRAT